MVDALCYNMEDRNLQEVLKNKVQHLFIASDREKKGFIVKKDMQHMRSEVPLTAEQLDAVFDALDTDSRKRVTLDQFIQGFGHFLPSKTRMSSTSEADSTTALYCPADHSPPQYHHHITQIRDNHLLDNEDVIRRLCDDVSQDGSEQMKQDLDEFLEQLVDAMRRVREGQEDLEGALRTRDEGHKVEIKKLYEEMDLQLNEEKERAALQMDRKMVLTRRQREEDLLQKDEELKEMISVNCKAELKIRLLESRELKLRCELDNLNVEKEELSSRLEAQCIEARQLRQSLRAHSKTTKQEQQRHEAAGFKLAQRIVLEQQGLMEQLRTLKTVGDTLERHSKQRRNEYENSYLIKENIPFI